MKCKKEDNLEVQIMKSQAQDAREQRHVSINKTSHDSLDVVKAVSTNSLSRIVPIVCCLDK